MARITYRKTRKGETITMHADKGEDLRRVIAEMAKPTEKAREELTADTITDEQIRELREDVLKGRVDFADGGFYTAIALQRPGADGRTAAARARCAEILNARAKETR